MRKLELVVTLVFAVILTPFLAICFPKHLVAMILTYVAIIAFVHVLKYGLRRSCRRARRAIARLPIFHRNFYSTSVLASITFVVSLLSVACLAFVLTNKGDEVITQPIGFVPLGLAIAGIFATKYLVSEDQLPEPESPEEKFELVATCITNDPTMAVCGVCGDGTGQEAVFCSDCGAPHHEECWTFNGGCSIYGCGEQRSTREPKKLQ